MPNLLTALILVAVATGLSGLIACGAAAVIHFRANGVTPASRPWQYLRARRIRREMRVLRRIPAGPVSLVDNEFAQIIAHNFEEAS